VYNKAIRLTFLGLLVIFCVNLVAIHRVWGEQNRDGFFWSSLSTDAKWAWLEGYLAASAIAQAWAQFSGIPDKLLFELMSTLEILNIAKKESDIRAIAKEIDAVYYSKKYYSIELVVALSIVKNKITRVDKYWQFQRDFYSLPIQLQEEFERKYYGYLPSKEFTDECRQKLDEFMQNRKKK